jgi:excisionase family DNA binding protein
LEDQPLTVSQVAHYIGRSRTTVQRLLKSGYMRRFKGRIAESSFEAFLREHLEPVPNTKLSPAQREKEWLVLNGFPDPAVSLKVPNLRGLLE